MEQVIVGQELLLVTQDEFLIIPKMFKQAKAQLIVCHQKWIDSITKQCDAMKTGLKAYRYLS